LFFYYKYVDWLEVILYIFIMESPKISKQPIFYDNRGSFIPIPIKEDWIQSNISFNDNIYTLRGLHLQEAPKRQSKQITVLKGKIVDIIVGLVGDELGKVYYYEMEEGDSLYVPKGFAHGFLTLKKNTVINYFVDEIYSVEHEKSIFWGSHKEVSKVVEDYLGDNRLTINQKDNQSLDFDEYIKSLKK
jgi:dTDP-4-dehydrorhamnose 3,5-epimerase